MEANIENSALYEVLINGEQQYSIWPVHKDVPLGWLKAGCEGTKEECLHFISQVWTDMQPLSLRTEKAPPPSGLPG